MDYKQCDVAVYLLLYTPCRLSNVIIKNYDKPELGM